jgi:hypothetical protein
MKRRDFLVQASLLSAALWTEKSFGQTAENSAEDVQLRQAYEKFKNLPPEQQTIIKERYEKFKRLSPEQRQRVRNNFLRWRRLNPQQKQRLKDRWSKFNSLPPARKQVIKDRWRKFRALPSEKKTTASPEIYKQKKIGREFYVKTRMSFIYLHQQS